MQGCDAHLGQVGLGSLALGLQFGQARLVLLPQPPLLRRHHLPVRMRRGDIRGV